MTVIPMRKSKKPGFLLNLLTTTKYFAKTRFLSPSNNHQHQIKSCTQKDIGENYKAK